MQPCIILVSVGNFIEQQREDLCLQCGASTAFICGKSGCAIKCFVGVKPGKDFTGSEGGTMSAFCEQGNESSGFLSGREIGRTKDFTMKLLTIFVLCNVAEMWHGHLVPPSPLHLIR